MTQTTQDTPKSPRARVRGGFLSRTKAYFGFGEPGVTWRQRKRVFLENERRSWARLLGSRRPEDACRPPADAE